MIVDKMLLKIGIAILAIADSISSKRASVKVNSCRIRSKSIAFQTKESSLTTTNEEAVLNASKGGMVLHR